jgi:UDP-N-acetylmuramoyl-tripeptide--D-alanyl-D-alanine ligase
LNARAAHLEGFGSIAGVIQGKGEIIDYTDPNGVVILNGDEPALEQWIKRAGDRDVITFGRKAADVRWTPISQQKVRLDAQDHAMTVHLPTLGQHFMENAAAAVAMALAGGATEEDIQLGLESAVIESGRMTPIQLEHCLLVDDTYNASPQAVRVAVDWLAHRSGHRILVMGGLSELGEAACLEMEALGAYAKSQGIDQLVATGAAAPIAEGFGTGSFYVETIGETVTHLSQMLAHTDTILIKGSRSAQMNRVVDAMRCQQGGR